VVARVLVLSCSRFFFELASIHLVQYMRKDSKLAASYDQWKKNQRSELETVMPIPKLGTIQQTDEVFLRYGQGQAA